MILILRGSWLASPTNASPTINPWTQQPGRLLEKTLSPDDVKIWDHKLNRPAAELYLTPKQVKHEDSSFCTGPLAECTNADLEKFLKVSQFSSAAGNGRQFVLVPRSLSPLGRRPPFKESPCCTVLCTAGCQCSPRPFCFPY